MPPHRTVEIRDNRTFLIVHSVSEGTDEGTPHGCVMRFLTHASLYVRRRTNANGCEPKIYILAPFLYRGIFVDAAP